MTDQSSTEQGDAVIGHPVAEQRYLAQGEKHPALGPHYFAARDVAEKFMEKFSADHFAPLIKKAAEDFHGQMQESLENYLLSDVESNIQGTIWHRIDESVKAILSGEKWAIERYALQKYDGPKIREAICKMMPVELQDERVKDLEEKLMQAEKDLTYYRAR